MLLLLLLLLMMLSCHHGWMAHLVHHSLPLLGCHPLTCPLLLLLLLGVLERGAHPLLLQLHLRGELALWQVALLGLLHGPTGTDHHTRGGTLLLIHVGPSCSHCCLGLWWHPLRSNHPSGPGVSHAHLLPLPLLVVRMRRHQACSSLGGLSLQSHLPLSISHLLNLHGDLHRRRGRTRGRLLLLL